MKNSASKPLIAKIKKLNTIFKADILPILENVVQSAGKMTFSNLDTHFVLDTPTITTDFCVNKKNLVQVLETLDTEFSK